MTLETHKYAAAAESFCFVTTEVGDQQDICNLTSMPFVPRSLYLNEVTNNFGSTKVEVPKGVGRSNHRHVGTLCCYLRKSSRNKSPNEISRTKKGISSENTKIL